MMEKTLGAKSSIILRRVLPLVAVLLLFALVFVAPVAADDTTTAVAEVGGTQYQTLLDAVNAAKTGEIITLLNDYTIATAQYTVYEMPEGSTLNLNGKTLTIPFATAMFAGKDIAIKNGTITPPTSTNTDYALYIGNAVNVDDERIETSITVKDVTVVKGGINVRYDAEATIEDCVVTVNPNRRYYAVYAGVGSTVTIQGGKYAGGRNKKDVYVDADATLTIFSGTFANEPAEKYQSGCYEASKNADGTWTITKKRSIITFKNTDGTELNKITEDCGTTVTAPTNPEKTGYTFANWVNVDGELVTFPMPMPVEDLLLTPTWTVNQYTITFDSKGGSAVQKITEDYGEEVTAPEAPTLTGHSFNGWEMNEVPYTFSTMPAENILLNATWTVNQYTISFDSNGGSAVPSITEDYGEEVTAPEAPTLTGHSFNGWVLNGAPYTFSTMPAENILLNATWTVNTYKITWENYDGSVLETDDAIPYGDTPTYNSATPTKPEDGAYTYTFAGWTPIVSAVMGDTTYTTTFTAVPKPTTPSGSSVWLTETPTPTPTETPTPSETPTETPTQPGDDDNDNGIPLAALIGGVAVLLIIAGLGVWLVIRRK